MNDRPRWQFRPDLERLEAKQTLSATKSAVAIRHAATNLAAPDQTTVTKPTAKRDQTVTAQAVNPRIGYLVYRITNANQFNNQLIPPFQHVRVQGIQPIPGQTYNILFVSVRNGTRQTFDANSQFLVRLPPLRRAFPILTGDQQWKPGETFIFYILSKKYYPLPSVVHSGFEFSLDGARSVGIPGPSGIFQRIKYNPATFDQVLDKIVTLGPGNQGGKGIKFGLPNTSVYEFVNSKTNRNDFSGYF